MAQSALSSFYTYKQPFNVTEAISPWPYTGGQQVAEMETEPIASLAALCVFMGVFSDGPILSVSYLIYI